MDFNSLGDLDGLGSRRRYGGGAVGVNRFYLPSSGAAAVSPTFSASWDQTTSADRIAMVTALSSTSKTNVTIAETSTSVINVLKRQYVSAPLNGAQSISGTVKGIILCAESNLAADFAPQITIYVVDNAGSTVTGTLISVDNSAISNELSDFVGVGVQNRKFPRNWSSPGTTLSGVSANNGDRIVVEIGFRSFNTSATSRTGTFDFGDNGASDALENETGTNNSLNPWIEFSQGLFF